MLLLGTWPLRLIQVPAGGRLWCVPAASLKPRVSHFHLLHLQCPKGNAPNLRHTYLCSSCGTRKGWKRLRSGPVYEQTDWGLWTSHSRGKRVQSNASAWGDLSYISFCSLSTGEEYTALHWPATTIRLKLGVVCAATDLKGDGKLHWRTVHRDEVLGAVPPENAVVVVHL